MYAGLVVEQGPTAELFRNAAHPYTRRLLAAIPRIEDARELVGIPGRAPAPGRRPPGCPFAPRCEIAVDACTVTVPAATALAPGHEARCIRIPEARAHVEVAGEGLERLGVELGEALLAVQGVDASYGPVRVVRDVSLRLERGECLALVGESGSGKTTLARSIGGLHGEWEGAIAFDGAALPPAARARSREQRRRIQYVFQNPYASLNPRRTVGQTVERPLSLLSVSGREATLRAHAMLERVALSADYAHRYPDELSGGERQRVAIARALICEPELVICDEVTSALDVSVQAAIVNLLAELQRDLGLSLLFVTHNLPLVRSLARTVAVMRNGQIVEQGTSEQVLLAPRTEYTRALLADSPRI
jgi:peptide/nickel transport system ATP-binding protein